MSDPGPIQLRPPPEPNPRIVRLLEETLALAREGRVQGLGLLALLTGTECAYSYRGRREPYLIAGMLEHMKTELLKHVDADGREVWFEDEPGGRDAPAKDDVP